MQLNKQNDIDKFSRDPQHISEEETLRLIAGVNYDTTSIDNSNPDSVVIQYKLQGEVIATETINKAGSIVNIIKS